MENDKLEAFLISRMDHPAVDVLLKAATPFYPLVYLGAKAHANFKLRRRRLPKPVISVGNITVGGTGKTSFVRLLLEMLEKEGLRTAVLSRGYKRTGRGLRVVSKGGGPLLGYESCGDEPWMIANWGTNAAVLVSRDRFEAGLAAMEEYSPDAFVLDDGFQHVSLERDLDIVLLDCTNAFGNGRIIPFGLLREPLSALRRADLIVVTRCNQSDIVEAVETLARQFARGVPLMRASHEPELLVSCDQKALDLGELRGRPVYAFSGIGNHSSFYLSVLQCGGDVKDRKPFPDHHKYTRDELLVMEREARGSGAEWLLTTEKDMVRIPDVNLTIPLYALTVRLRILSGMELLESALDKALQPPLSP